MPKFLRVAYLGVGSVVLAISCGGAPDVTSNGNSPTPGDGDAATQVGEAGSGPSLTLNLDGGDADSGSSCDGGNCDWASAAGESAATALTEPATRLKTRLLKISPGRLWMAPNIFSPRESAFICSRASIATASFSNRHPDHIRLAMHPRYAQYCRRVAEYHLQALWNFARTTFALPG